MKTPLLPSLILGLAPLLLAGAETPPGLAAIRLEEIRADLGKMADAHFRGRSAGTVDELRAAVWIAERYRAIGLEPAGEDGTYFQFFSLGRHELSPASTVEISGHRLELWKDVMVSQFLPVHLDAPIVYLGNAADVDLANVDVAGKVVALESSPKGMNLDVSLPTWRYPRYNQTNYALPLINRGARAVIFVADPVAENGWADATENYKRGLYQLESDPNPVAAFRAPILWVHGTARAALQAGPATFKAELIVTSYTYPTVNLVGRVRGTDPTLRAEHVLFSGHTDAHGVRNEIKGDSIFYGADDNASVNVALLASAKAFAQHPGRRSVLFVIHGAEERGLFGSRYYSAHPTVPLDSIVAVLNGDMIGRNAPGQAALLGAVPPHRNSADLVAMALAANREGPNFTLTEGWDDVKHVEGWYFRSDHLPYARLGIPAVMYSTLLHPDYHTPQDNAANIDYDKLTKMTEWMYRTGWKAANADQRPGRDKDFKLER
jgi:hypothetical protein